MGTQGRTKMATFAGANSIGSVWDRRRHTLGMIGIAQLMIVLDVTVMNIALPSAQHAPGRCVALRSHLA